VIETGHRPWPPPSRPWALGQRWHDLLFMHWPVEPRALAALVPAPLELQTFDGRAWLGIVPFRMSDVRLRGLPALPWLSAFPELNVRTYVSLPGPGGAPRPGVWFFSLDAARWAAVQVARATFGLPYVLARMRCETDGDGVRYRSRRLAAGGAGAGRAPGATPVELVARYEPTGPVQRAAPGSLEHFLTERYCLYAAGRSGGLRRAEIHHAPWPLQPAAAEIERNSMAAPLGLESLPGAPLLHFARRLDVHVWWPRPFALAD